MPIAKHRSMTALVGRVAPRAPPNAARFRPTSIVPMIMVNGFYSGAAAHCPLMVGTAQRDVPTLGGSVEMRRIYSAARNLH
jgi:hypothetical protein